MGEERDIKMRMRYSIDSVLVTCICVSGINSALVKLFKQVAELKLHSNKIKRRSSHSFRTHMFINE